ncbi:MAG: hypothetical protein JNN30_02730 [Rhodanobacteraceae bacterium]|nr:hypothetical protein [Rhodanobacteraceae bacterium]
MNTITARRQGALRSCACLLLFAAVHPGIARAATFTVANTADSGTGSLRDIIGQANNTTGADTITFANTVTGTITLTSGSIDITEGLRVIGPGATRLTISGNNSSRIFRIHPAAASDVIAVDIAGLAFTNGSSADEGGAIFADDSNLTITSCLFSNNTAQRGGGLYAFPTVSTTLTLRGTRFENNTAVINGGGFGAQDIDNVVVDNVVATGNSASRNGGGAYLRAVRVEISQSEFSNNTSSTQPPNLVGITGGGGLRIDGSKATATATVTDTRFVSNNAQQGQGGAIWISAQPPVSQPVVATARLDRVQLTANTANLTGGGVSADFVNTTFKGASFANNTSQQSGGGIAYQDAGALLLTNSTLAGNSSALAQGGGIYSAAETGIEVSSSTIVGNSAATGGGILRTGSGAVIRNSIVANNNAATAPDASGSFSTSYSLIKNTTGTTLGAGTGNLAPGTDPLLGTLGINGGSTLSLLPSATSPALNAGDPAGSGLAPGDQRELPRVAAGRVDLGAIERQSPEDVIFRYGY